MSAYLKKLSLLWMTLALVGAVLPTHAQTFSSGSSGMDGDFLPTANVTLQVPASGIFNFKTITIPSGVTVTFTRNAQNTPVTMLATGDVLINGTIDISGGNGSNVLTGPNTGTGNVRPAVGKGGPGGFDGGGGGTGSSFLSTASGLAGDGPGGGGGSLGNLDTGITGAGGGGGFATPGVDGNSTRGGNGKGGPAYGSPTLLQLIGGSGGGGNASFAQGYYGYSGGGGGGAIVIASSTTISAPSYATFNATGGGGGGYGAGGAVRLVANTLSGTFYVNLFTPALEGGNGFARFEAFNFVNFAPNIGHSLGTVTVALPSSVTLPYPPTLQIVSVGGVVAPSAPKGDFNAQPDITLDANAPNPAVVNLAAANMPVNTVINVQMSPEQGDKVNVFSTPLTGTTTASSATATVTLPASLLSVLIASVTIDLSSVQMASTGSGGGHALVARTPPLMLEGELVTRMEVASAFGGGSDVVYITKSGKRFSRSQLLGRMPKRVVRN